MDYWSCSGLWVALLCIIRGLYESDHNPHEQQLLALHQVRSSNERPMKSALKYNKEKSRNKQVPIGWCIIKC